MCQIPWVGDRFLFLVRLFFVSICTSRRGCGNCGKLDALGRVFQGLGERWKNAVLFFHGFPSAISFHSPVLALLDHFRQDLVGIVDKTNSLKKSWPTFAL